MQVTGDLLVAFAAIVVTVIVGKILRLYYDWYIFPRGPFPWPLVGNLLHFRQPLFAHEVITRLASRHGKVYTLFLGHKPFIVIAEPTLAIQALKKQTFAGRPSFPLTQWLFGDKGTDIAFSDFTKEWEALRRVGHGAARKYAVSPTLASIVVNVVDRVIASAGTNMDTEEWFSTMMNAINAESAFGKTYDFDDPEFRTWKQAIDQQQTLNTTLILFMILPLMRYVFRRDWNTFTSAVKYERQQIKKMYQLALKNYTEGKNDTFCDAIIASKRDAESQESWMLPYLHEENILNCIFDLFANGTDAQKCVLQWIFVFVTRHPDMQDKMRQEVDSVIGDRDPEIPDRANCHYVTAFIAEVMRFRPFAPTGMMHKVTVNEHVNKISIPEGTAVLMPLYDCLHDELVWKDPHVFTPDRFLDEFGNFVPRPNPQNVPFGDDGRRACIGNKLTLHNMFLIVSRFLQKTGKISTVGGVGEDHVSGDLVRSNVNAWITIPYSLKLDPRS